MMSPTQYREFIVDSLRQQAKKLDNVLYHLDGPDAIQARRCILWRSKKSMRCSGPAEIMDRMGHWKTGMKFMTRQEEPENLSWIKVYTGTVDDWIPQCGSAGTKIWFPQYAALLQSDVYGRRQETDGLCRRALERCKRDIRMLIRWRKRA